VIIRLANIEEDALAIFEGAKDFASRVSFQSYLPDNDADFITTLHRLVIIPGVEILLAEHETKVVGGIGMFYAPYLWNEKRLMAEELFWWTAKDAPYRTGKLLIDEAMKRLNERDAIPIFRMLDTSPKGVEKVYRRLDMVPVETTFMRLI